MNNISSTHDLEGGHELDDGQRVEDGHRVQGVQVPVGARAEHPAPAPRQRRHVQPRRQPERPRPLRSVRHLHSLNTPNRHPNRQFVQFIRICCCT